MAKRVIDVGNCGPDHSSIRQFLERHFSARLELVDDADEALAALRSAPADLVLVNRHLDRDGTDGLDVIDRLKADPVSQSTPVMLVTNYPEFQDQAVARGAERGFGKRDLHKPDTAELLRKWLG